MTSTVTNGSADKAGLLSGSGGGGDEEPNLVGSSFSLVRYNNPILIDKHPETPSITPPSSGNSHLCLEKSIQPNFYQIGKKKKDDSESGDTESEAQRSETEEILDSILPPREWEESGQLWRQSVSSTPATRLDVINLQEQLDQKLEQRQARETGICQVSLCFGPNKDAVFQLICFQVRRELYAQCFDELIRQCTINCVERGLLLLRVRDELRMTLHAYQTLYESSIAFGIRKALQAEQVCNLICLPFVA